MMAEENVDHYKHEGDGVVIRVMGELNQIQAVADKILAALGPSTWRGPALRNKYDSGFRIYINTKVEGGKQDAGQG